VRAIDLGKYLEIESRRAEHVQVGAGTSLLGKLGHVERDKRATERRPERVSLRGGAAADTVVGLEGERSKD